MPALQNFFDLNGDSLQGNRAEQVIVFHDHWAAYMGERLQT
jgi:hypothetical protein